MQSIWEHLEDLRKTVLKSLGVVFLGMLSSLFFIQPLLTFLAKTASGGEFSNNPLVFLSPLEGVFISFRLAFWVGLCLASPFVAFFVFQFAAPGLYQKEKQVAIPFFLSAFLAGFLGAVFAFKGLVPLANAFLVPFNASFGVNLWSFAAYFDYLFLLTSASIITLEIGVLLFWLVYLGVISKKVLISFRRYAVVLAFILGAFLTPPDVLTQLLVAGLLLLMYEGAILFARARK